MEKPRLNRLTPEVINQIAAGEVIERPASVVKELLDNSIDANSSKIVIKIKNGGMDLIEISDDGIGIPEENLNGIFDAHTTSKLKNIEDLNNLMSMGFRGEALSTITSVAKVTLVSKYDEEEVGHEIQFNENGKSSIKKNPREKGTLVRVEDLFYNIPARKKYLKSSQTEYRKIYELLNKYFLIYPNIHFILEKDGKQVLDLPNIKESKPGEIRIERANDIFPEDSTLSIFYDGSGISITGITGHPSLHSPKLSKQFIFVNNRPISEHGIVRAIYEGYSRYLPFGEKIPFIVNVKINPDLVDINVHPRKEEVRFENAFRVYSAVEEAIKRTLEKALSYRNTEASEHQQSFSQMRDVFTNKQASSQPSTGYQEIRFDKKASSVKDSLLFSQQLLDQSQTRNVSQEEPISEEQEIKNIFQIFDKYIVIEFTNSNLWIIDQHAAAERINFEKISNREKVSLEIQNLLVPETILFSKEELLFLNEYQSFFKSLGFEYTVSEKDITITTTPAGLTSNTQQMFKEIFELADNISSLKKNFDRRKDDVLATIACHTSVRSGQRLEKSEMISMYKQLLNCKNPYSCPHGRPAVWKLTIEEIDKNFERTY